MHHMERIALMNQRVMITKRLLKEALIELLKGSSISRITIVKLCESAGINRSTFYAYYSCPEDVLLEIGHDNAEEISRLTQGLGDASLREQLLIACTYIYETRDVQRVLIQNTSIDDIQAMLQTVSFESVFSGADGGGEPVDEAAGELARVFLTSGIYNVVRHWIMNEIDKTPEEVVNIITTMISRIVS